MANKEFSFETRETILEAAPTKNYDIIIIGGGITGAGAARDAASRGMKVLLVEQSDFAQGTSSRSSKLIHGGIRYLENFEFGLVFEALSERRILFDLAPHLVHPLRFVLPLYEEGRVGMFKMGLGMWAYDALALFEAPEMHRHLDPDETIEQLPFLRDRELLGSYAYYDAYMDDDRLVLETLRSANEKGADCVNFVKASSPIWKDGKVIGLECEDQLEKKSFQVRAKHILSCVGPWTDDVGAMLMPDWKKKLRPSKGIHLTLRRDRLPLKDAVVMAADAEKRIVFGIPRHEMIIIGTTDTDYKGDPGQVHSVDADVDYLLKIVNDYFPKADLTRSDVIASYSGVRPLVHDGSATESGTSREHMIYTDNRGVTFVAGGKYTTYRAMAEECVDAVIATRSLEDQVKFKRASTKEPLNSKATQEIFQQREAHVQSLSKEFGLSIESTRLLFDRHGLEAWSLIRKLKAREMAGSNSSEQVLLWQAEVDHAIDNTMCLNLLDFYLRRSPLFLSYPDHGFSMMNDLLEVFSEKLSWDESKRKQELNALQEYLKFEMGWRH